MEQHARAHTHYQPASQANAVMQMQAPNMGIGTNENKIHFHMKNSISQCINVRARAYSRRLWSARAHADMCVCVWCIVDKYRFHPRRCTPIVVVACTSFRFRSEFPAIRAMFVPVFVRRSRRQQHGYMDNDAEMLMMMVVADVAAAQRIYSSARSTLRHNRASTYLCISYS